MSNSGEYLILPEQPHELNKKKIIDFSCLGLKGQVANRHMHQDVAKDGRVHQTFKQNYHHHEYTKGAA